MFKRLHITFPTLCLHEKAQIPFTFYFLEDCITIILFTGSLEN